MAIACAVAVSGICLHSSHASRSRTRTRFAQASFSTQVSLLNFPAVVSRPLSVSSCFCPARPRMSIFTLLPTGSGVDFQIVRSKGEREKQTSAVVRLCERTISAPCCAGAWLTSAANQVLQALERSPKQSRRRQARRARQCLGPHLRGLQAEGFRR